MSATDNSINQEAPTHDVSNKFALVVGVNNSSTVSPYRHTLKYAEKDAEDMAYILKQPECGFMLMAPPIIGEKATTPGIKQAVMNLILKRTEQDFLLFYIAGHAVPINNDIYFVTYDFQEDTIEVDPDFYLSMRWLWKVLYQSSRAGRVLLILDCCFAGNMVETKDDPFKIDFRKLLDEWNTGTSIKDQKNFLRLILTATGYNIQAQELDGHGLMTGLLLKALHGEIDDVLDKEGHVDIRILHTYLQHHMPKEQRPDLAGKFGPYNCILASHSNRSERLRRQVIENDMKIEVERGILSELLKLHAETQHTQPFDHAVCHGASLADLDEEKITEFLKRERTQQDEAFLPDISAQAQLMHFGFLQNAFPTYGALLCFGQAPSKWVAGATTRCVEWDDNPSMDRMLDSREYRGSLLRQFELSLNFLKKKLRLSRVISREGREEQWEIPPAVVEEALANALMHREYANRTDSMRVEVFNDRIEISSPGTLPSPMTEELLRVKHKSYPRNPQIAGIFYLYGYIEKFGTGIQRMQRFMKEANLPEPEFRFEDDETVTVVLYRHRFDPSFYVDTFIRQYENWELREKEQGIVDPIFSSKLFGIYVPLGFKDEKGQYFGSLDKYVQQWLIDDGRRNLVLLGEYGSGKTSFCLSLCHRLLIQYRDKTNDAILPIYLSFRDIVSQEASDIAEKKTFEILSDQYNIKMGEFSDFSSALQNRKILLILDGLDEIVSSLDIELIQRQFSTLKNILIHCYKVIITSRTNYFYSEADIQYIFPLSSQNIGLLDTMVGSSGFELLYLSDFEEEHRKQYIQNTIKDEQHRAYILETIRKTLDLSDLSRRPILLSMIVRSFGDVKLNDTETITQTFLYDMYILNWLRREYHERYSAISIEDKLLVLEGLALKLFKEGTAQIHREDLADFLSKSFEGQHLGHLNINQIEYEFATSSFLTRTKDNYFGFVHRSFLEFFVARALLREIQANKPDFFGQRRLFGTIATFLKELIEQGKQQEKIEEHLIEWMIASRDLQNSETYLGGNSASLLCRLGFSFEGLDLSHVFFKDADLTGGNFYSCTLHGANVDGSILTRADLSESNLQDANLNNTFIKETLFKRSNLHGASFKNIRMIGGPNTIWKAAFSIDKSNIAIGTDQGYFVILPSRSKEIKDQIMFRVDETAILHFAFSPNGELLAIADRNKHIHLYSWSKLIAGETQRPRVFSDNADYVRWLDFSPKGDVLVSGGRDHLVKLWFLEGHSQVKELAFHSGPIMYTTWAPDGKMIASAGYDNNICLWYIDDKDVNPLHLHERGSKTSHDGIVRSLAFNKDGTILASGGEDNVIKFWSLVGSRRPKLMAKLSSDANIFCMEWIEDGKILLVGDADGFIGRIDVANRQVIQRIRAHNDIVRSFSIDERSGFLLTASWDGTVKLWKLADLSLIDDKIFRLDQEEILYQPKDAFQQAKIKGIRHLSETFRRCFIMLGATEE